MGMGYNKDKYGKLFRPSLGLHLPLCSVVNDNQYSNGICFIVCVCMWPSDKAPLNLDYYKAGLS